MNTSAEAKAFAQRMDGGYSAPILAEPKGGPIPSAPDTRHLPGKHNQKDHGRRGGVRASLNKAKTTAEISAVVAGEASALVGDDFVADFTGADPQVARDFGEGILQGLEKYPATPLREVGTYGQGSRADIHNARAASESRDLRLREATAFTIQRSHSDYVNPVANLPNGTHTAGTAIYFNNGVATPRHFKIRADAAKEAAENGWPRSNVSTSARHVALHEFGHAAAYHTRPGDAESAVGSASWKAAAAKGVDPRHFVQHGVSYYAAANDAELTAEVFADVMINGSKAAPLSKDLFSVLDARLKGWEAEVGRP